jgi:hypothetical protein
LFTRDFRKVGLAVCALVVVMGVYVAVITSLSLLAFRAEVQGEVYPYKSEDWLRYMLPSFFVDDGRPVLMLTGPSSVRENLAVEIFQREFPGYRVFQGGLSLGTLTDVIAALEYVEEEYGRSALPQVLVLGVAPRFLAEVPEQRPFVPAINRYSPYRCTVDAEGEVSLTAKPGPERLWAEFLFRTQKQTPRFQVAVLSAIRSFLPADFDQMLRDSRVAHLASMDESGLRRGLTAAVNRGPRTYISDLISPYKFRFMPRPEISGLVNWISAPDSFWAKVYEWDPDDEAASIRARILRLREFIAERDIRLFVINMPEREIGRVRYDPVHYARYEEIVQEGFEGSPLLDLRETPEDSEFHDVVHLNGDGAARVTHIVISFLRRHGV